MFEKAMESGKKCEYWHHGGQLEHPVILLVNTMKHIVGDDTLKIEIQKV